MIFSRRKQPKTRIVEIDSGFVPQYYREFFPWGGEWVGLSFKFDGDLYSFTSESAQIDNCVHKTYKEASDTLTHYLVRNEAKLKLRK